MTRLMFAQGASLIRHLFRKIRVEIAQKDHSSRGSALNVMSWPFLNPDGVRLSRHSYP